MLDFSELLTSHEASLLQGYRRAKEYNGGVMRGDFSIVREHILLGKTTVLQASPGAQRLCAETAEQLPTNLLLDSVLEGAFWELEKTWQQLHPREKFDPNGVARHSTKLSLVKTK